MRPSRTSKGDATTRVILATFRLNGLLLDAGDRLGAAEGITSARWQVLGAIAVAGRPLLDCRACPAPRGEDEVGAPNGPERIRCATRTGI